MKVLVHGGSGGVGIAAIQLAVDAGMEVFATAGSPEGIELMKEQGAHHTYNHRENNYENQIQTDSKVCCYSRTAIAVILLILIYHIDFLSLLQDGVDMVIEMLANVNLETDMNLLRKNGAILVVGNRGTVEINPRGLMRKEADIRSVLFYFLFLITVLLSTLMN